MVHAFMVIILIFSLEGGWGVVGSQPLSVSCYNDKLINTNIVRDAVEILSNICWVYTVNIRWERIFMLFVQDKDA